MEFFLITRRYIWFLHNTPPLQVVRGTLEALATPVQSMGINHRGFHVFIYGRGAPGSSNCRSCFQKIRRIGNVWLSNILALLRNFIKFKNSDGVIQYYGITTIYRYEDNFFYRYSAFRSQFFVKM